MLYLAIAIADHGSLWGRFVISVLLGSVLLLAFHTSHVRARGFVVGVVLVVIADVANLVQALLDRHGGDGSTFIMFGLVLIAPVVILNRIIRHETRRPRDHPRRDLRLRADRDRRSRGSTAR